MNACVFLHNMIIESERVDLPNDNHPYDFVAPLTTIAYDVPANFADFITMHAEIQDVDAQTQLQNNLLEHLWRIKGNTEATTS
jgi:hypothetical protein